VLAGEPMQHLSCVSGDMLAASPSLTPTAHSWACQQFGGPARLESVSQTQQVLDFHRSNIACLPHPQARQAVRADTSPPHPPSLNNPSLNTLDRPPTLLSQPPTTRLFQRYQCLRSNPRASVGLASMLRMLPRHDRLRAC
jgi:hypothetical protein